MYQRLPASLTPESRHLSAPVIKVFQMVEEREEYEMVDLLTGQYLVCAEVRLGNTSLQSDCFQAEVDSDVKIVENTVIENAEDSYENIGEMDNTVDKIDVGGTVEEGGDGMVGSSEEISVEDGLELGIIIAICLSGLALLALASYSVFCLVVRNRRRIRER